MTATTHALRPRRISESALVFSALAAVAFLVVRPRVGDFWAARARASAAGHGVGLHYWFSWFGGTVPGHYSVLGPFFSRFVDVGVLGATATVAIPPLVHLLVRGAAHPTLATWLAAIGSAVNLWSGRVPFAEATALALVALLLVRANRPIPAAAIAAFTALVSPVSAAFLVIGLVGVFLHDRGRRVVTVATAAGAGVCLLVIAVYFGSPGPEGFQPVSALLTAGAFAVMLAARPSAAVRAALLIGLVACPLVAIIPNGMGSNFERLAWLCMPVATAATATAGRRVILVTTLGAMTCTLVQSGKDLTVAANPISAPSYYNGLVDRLDHTPDLANYRVEVVPDGTHVASYALLDHASLARGYETQSDNELAAVLGSPQLNAQSYRAWLSEYAVRYIAIDRTTLQHGPEDTLVRTATPDYLHKVWNDANWTLYEVQDATPIVAAPAQIVRAEQSRLIVSTPRAATLRLQVRFSTFLKVRGPVGSTPRLAPSPDGLGFTNLTLSGPGQFVLTG